MKKFFAVLLALCMAAGFCACGAPPAADSKPPVTAPGGDGGAKLPGGETGDPASLPSEEGEPPAPEFARGSFSGRTYTNESMGVSFTLPEGWVAATDEEMAEAMGLSKEIVNDETRLALELGQAQTVMDAMVQDSVSFNNFNVIYEDLAKVTGGASVDEEAYLAATAALLQNSGIDYVFGDVEEITLGGDVYLTQPFTGAYQGVSMPQLTAVRRVGDRMICITFTSVDGADFTEFFAFFD